MRTLRSSSLVLGSLLCAAPAWAAVTIDTAQQSGVKGYPIGVFGTGFGASQGNGKVTILGATATITKWSDTVIEAVVPTATPAAGQLVVTGSDATTAQSPFELYVIDPKFLARPADLINLAYKKKFVVVGTHSDWAGNPVDFLGFNDGSSGNDHAADFNVPFSLAVDLGSALSEEVWFSWFGNSGSDWPEGGNLPANYTIDASADSTDGINGTWTTLATVTGYARKSRIDKVTMTGQHWIRMSVTAYYPGKTAVNIAEIRVYKRKVAGGTGIDSIGIFGDSITYADHRETGPGSICERIQTGKNDGTTAAVQIMGMIGQSTGCLAKSATDLNSLATAITLTPELRYYGISLGTNVRTPMKQDFIDGVDQLLAVGKVPILARMPDTDPVTGMGTADYRKSVLLAVDQVAAQYKLIPGPDFYTPFRQNTATYLSDGTHHSGAGATVERQLWADTFLRSGIYGGNLAPPSDAGAGGGAGSGGSTGSGGVANSGGSTGSGGKLGAGGTTGAGGGAGKGGAALADGGSAGAKDAGKGGSAGAGGSVAATGGSSDESTDTAAPDSGSSCGCRLVGAPVPFGAWLALIGLALGLRRRQR